MTALSKNYLFVGDGLDSAHWNNAGGLSVKLPDGRVRIVHSKYNSQTAIQESWISLDGKKVPVWVGTDEVQ